MTQGTDVSEVAAATSGIVIAGPGQPLVPVVEVPAVEPQIDIETEEDFTVDPDAPDLDEDTEVENPYASGELLFDTARYLAVPTLDGQATDKITVSFGGSITWDAADEEGRQVFEALTLGKPVELRVAGFVAGKQGAYKENADGESVVTGKAVLKIVTFYNLSPEQL